MKNKLFAYKMTAPTIFALLVMTVYPVIFTLVYSFTDYIYRAVKLHGIIWKYVFPEVSDKHDRVYIACSGTGGRYRPPDRPFCKQFRSWKEDCAYIHSAAVSASGCNGGTYIQDDAFSELRDHNSGFYKAWTPSV